MAAVKFYVAPSDFRWAGLNVAQACRRIGASVTLSPSGATHCFAASDSGALDLARAAEDHKLPFATKAALASLSDRLELAKVGVPTIRSLEATSPEALAQTFAGPVFVKKRLHFGKQSGDWVYTRWGSAQELIAAADESFWGVGYVVQDYLGEQVCGFDTTIAVNESGEILVVANTKFVFSNPCTADSASSNELPAADVLEAIQKTVHKLGIAGGIYGVQIAQAGDKQMIMDWNIRPGYSHVLYLMGKYKLFDRALAHVAGLDLPAVAPLHIENRHYKDALHKAEFAKSLGLIVRHDLIYKPDVARIGLDRGSLTLLAVGSDKAQVAEKIQAFEESLK